MIRFNRQMQTIVRVVVYVVCIIVAVQAFLYGAILDMVFGSIFLLYLILVILRFVIKRGMRQPQPKQKPVSQSAATARRIFNNFMDSDIIVYLYIIYWGLKNVLPGLLAGRIFTLVSYNTIFLVFGIVCFVDAARYIFGLDKFRNSERRRTWDVYDVEKESIPAPQGGTLCPHCGGAVTQGDKICRHCGQSMVSERVHK